MIIVLFISIMITLLISGVFSLAFLFTNRDLAITTFWLTFAIQWLIFQPINRILSIKQEKLEIKKLRKIEDIGIVESKQKTILECAYCGEKNKILIDVNGENVFKCSECENLNSIVLQFTTVRITEPLLTDLNTTSKDIYSELDDILEDDEEVKEII